MRSNYVIKKSLLLRGIKEDQVEGLLRRAPSILTNWERIKGLSLADRQKRDKGLAIKIRQVARVLDSYVPGELHGMLGLFFAVQEYKLIKGLVHSPHDMAKELRLYAFCLENGMGSFSVGDSLFKDRPYKGTKGESGIKTYCINRVFDMVESFLNGSLRPRSRYSQGRAPNKETAMIVTALLDLKTPIKGNDVSAARKKVRRPYRLLTRSSITPHGPPTPGPCRRCGGLMVFDNSQEARCLNCGHVVF